jgi:hypothetical protein
MIDLAPYRAALLRLTRTASDPRPAPRRCLAAGRRRPGDGHRPDHAHIGWSPARLIELLIRQVNDTVAIFHEGGLAQHSIAAHQLKERWSIEVRTEEGLRLADSPGNACPCEIQPKKAT